MTSLLILVRLALAAVFGVAGVAKALDQRGTREAVANFGAPAGTVRSLAFLLPLSEIAMAIGLVLPVSAWFSAIGALALLALFIVAISFNLYRGQVADCHCFGQLYSRPLGWPTLVRNFAFAALAGFIIWRGPIEVGAGSPWFAQQLGADRTVAIVIELVLAALIVTVVIFVWLKSRNQSTKPQATTAVRGLPLNSPAPAFDVNGYASEGTSLDRLLIGGKPLMLIFVSPKCGPCIIILEEIAQWQQAHSEQATIAVISTGTIKDNFVNVARNGVANFYLQQEREVAESYHAHLTPTAVLVTTEGRIGSDLAPGADEIRKLLQRLI
jgi:uncharacterized membrane protein YphA (DoxX/SURF4 family)/thiol-disulfide isomerase/thioredoxin